MDCFWGDALAGSQIERDLVFIGILESFLGGALNFARPSRLPSRHPTRRGDLRFWGRSRAMDCRSLDSMVWMTKRLRGLLWQRYVVYEGDEYRSNTRTLLSRLGRRIMLAVGTRPWPQKGGEIRRHFRKCGRELCLGFLADLIDFCVKTGKGESFLS